jgi:hypothetical protein
MGETCALHTKFMPEKFKGRDHSGDRNKIKTILKLLIN